MRPESSSAIWIFFAPPLLFHPPRLVLGALLRTQGLRALGLVDAVIQSSQHLAFPHVVAFLHQHFSDLPAELEGQLDLAIAADCPGQWGAEINFR